MRFGPAEPRSAHGEFETQSYLKDVLMLGVDLTKFRCMHVKQVKQLIKLKKNEACEENCHNIDHWCKSEETHLTLGKCNI